MTLKALLKLTVAYCLFMSGMVAGIGYVQGFGDILGLILYDYVNIRNFLLGGLCCLFVLLVVRQHHSSV